MSNVFDRLESKYGKQHRRFPKYPDQLSQSRQGCTAKGINLPSMRHSIRHTPDYALDRVPGYNFTANYDVVARPSSIFINKREPDPYIELLRAQGIERIRSRLEVLSKQLGLPSSPRAGLLRFLFEQRTHSLLQEDIQTSQRDVLLTNPDAISKTDVLRRELLAEIPLRIPMTLRFGWKQCWRLFDNYLMQTRYWQRQLEELDKKENIAKINKFVYQASTWKDHHGRHCTLPELYAQLRILRDECTPIFHTVYKERVDSICKTLEQDISTLVDELAAARRCLEDGSQKIDFLLVQHDSGNKDDVEDIKETVNHDCESCGSLKSEGIMSSVSKDSAEILQVSQQGEGNLQTVTLTYREDVVVLTKFHCEKLRKLYNIHSKQHNCSCKYAIQQEKGCYDKQEAAREPCLCPIDETHFAKCLYVLARRYKTFIGDEAEGGAFHAAAPETTFDTLREDFGVCQEQFASPFNCHFRQPQEGSFETGPPYTEEVMDQMADRLHYLLENSTGPLSFIVFVPEWRSPPCHALVAMEQSKYLREHFVAPGRQHTYISGVQHTENGLGGFRYYVVPHGTELFFLQNDAGFSKWTPTKEKINRFKASLGISVDDDDEYPRKRHSSRR